MPLNKCYSFVRQEAELQQKDPRVLRETILSNIDFRAVLFLSMLERFITLLFRFLTYNLFCFILMLRGPQYQAR
jgi:hypothetical protein